MEGIFALAFLGALGYFIYKMYKKNRNATVFSIVGIAALIFVIVQYNESIENNKRLKREMEWKSKCETVESVEQFINGTTWTYTETITDGDDLNMWVRLKFSNGKVTHWQVSPSEGSWGEPEVCNYTVEKARYSNTGESYIRVNWQSHIGMHYVFVPENRSFNFRSGYHEWSKDAKLKDEDCNPWKD